MAENLQRLRAIRGGHRGVTTKILKEIDEVLSQISAETLSSELITKLNTLKLQINSKLSTLNAIDEKILAICDVKDIDNEISESETYATKVTESTVKLESAIQEATTPVVTQTQPVTNSTTTNNEVGSNSSRSRLPKLVLPHFKGDVTKWATFWDSFKSAVHENTDIKAVDKFNYLNSLLEGQAARAIQGLTLTEANYESAVKLLQERFGKPQQIIAAHMDELLKIPSCHGDKAASIRYVYDLISVHVRGLATMGVSSEQYGSLLIPIIMSKLSTDIRLRIAREVKGQIWEIDELMQIIKSEVEAKEASESTKVTRDGVTDDRKFKSNQSTTRALVNNEKQNRSQNVKIQYVYCDGLHYSASCERVVKVRERKAILKAAGRCFRCVYKGHHVRECKGPRNCRHCDGQHHQSICLKHESNSESDSKQPEDKSNQSQLTETTTTVASGTTSSKRHVLLQTARANAANVDGSKSVSVRILFDNGSQRSYITDSLRSKLGLKVEKFETLRLNTFGDNKYKKQRCQVFKFNFETADGTKLPVSALGFPVICSPIGTKVEISSYPHLQDLDLADCITVDQDSQSIDVLIGSDHYWDFITGEVVRGDDGSLAIASKFGWLLSGPTHASTTSNDTEVVSNLIIAGGSEFDLPNDSITQELKRFWDIEAIGISDENASEANPITNESRSDIAFNGERYEVALPWKRDCLPLPDNFESCNNRLLSLRRKLQKHPKLLNEYHTIIQEQIEAGIVEKVVESRKNPVNTVGTHYSPHHPVVRQDKDTTKIRIVYDGSAKPGDQEHSLNDCLETGPNFIPHIFDLLIKFRSNPIALTADIEKAFLMVGMKKEDKDMLRFLWFDNPLRDDPTTIVLRFNRLMFGLRPSPSILGSVIQFHLDSYRKSEPEMAELLSKAFYVDDLVTGESNVPKVFEIYEKSKSIMAAGGFNLRKWNSNSNELLRRIDRVETKSDKQDKPQSPIEDDESFAKLTTGPVSPTSTNTVKLLGVGWNTCSDTISFDFEELQKYASSLPITKRSLLTMVAKIFDPLGLLSRYTVTMKILFQILCLDQFRWDQELDGELKSKFLAIQREIIHLNSVHVPRYYFYSDANPVTVELHGFSDSSQSAYAAVVYLRSIYCDGRIHVTLVAAKSRVAPTKRQSIPRLELLGALILARLTRKIKDIIGEIHTTHWVDSTTVLFWIKNDNTWKQYVRNRVSEIRTLTFDDTWRFCPGSDNPADLPSRGLGPEELVVNNIWWNGPEFLQRATESWPSDISQGNATNEIAMAEMIKQSPEITHTLAVNDATSDRDIANCIDIKRYSNLTKLLRVTAYVLRFVRRIKDKRNVQFTTKEVDATEMNGAEILWINSTQRKSFPKEYEILTNNLKNMNTPYISQFGLYIGDEGIIRCKGRINNSPLATNSKNPVFMPSKDDFVHLLIRHVHNDVKHSGLRTTLTVIRERFWILRGRASVKRIINKCVICRRYEGVSLPSSLPPDLPEERVADDPPFTHTGLDFAGPLYAFSRQTKESTSNVEQSNCEKYYVLLFTCASTRAVHLELTQGVSVSAFLLAIRRFASRRGLPATILSDNAKTFKAANKELQKIIRSKEVERFLAEKRISWRFIVERTPWWGGFWERLVRSVKRPLKKVVGKSTLSIDELQTILIEIEAIINSRPITYLYGDDESGSYPLTPSDLIYGRRITSEPNSSHYEVVSTNQALTRRVRHQRSVLKQLTSLWRREYLTSLREQATAKKVKSTAKGIMKGDVVIVKKESTPRAFWKIAIVKELIPSADGIVRAATIKMSSENGKNVITRRSVQHLVPLEVNSTTTVSDQTGQTSKNEIIDEQPTIPRPEVEGRTRRTAAVVGELARRLRN